MRQSWWAGPSLLRGVAVRIAAIGVFVLAWQVVVWSRWKPQFLLPSPFTVLDAMVHHPGEFTHDAGTTVARAALGMGLALVLGVGIGLVGWVTGPIRSILRSLVAGLSTLPAVIWIPALLIVIGPKTAVLVFVMVVGAAPPIARGVIDGFSRRSPRSGDATAGSDDPRPTPKARATAALPDALAGVRTGWAACWGALLAGEIILTLPSLGLGGQLVNQRGLNDNVAVYQVMIIIFVLGVLVDGLVLGSATRAVSRRRGGSAGLDDSATR